MQKHLHHYVRTERLAAGLTQAELGSFLGYSAAFVQKCETEERAFTARFVVGCGIIFGKPAATIFPALVSAVQDQIGRAALALDERLRDRIDEEAKKQHALLATISENTITLDL
jgi:hypothetical protein